MDQRTSAQRRMAGRAARSGAVHSAASAITFSMAATTALVLRIRASIATTASPSRHFRSACVHTLGCGFYPLRGEALVAAAAALDGASAGEELHEEDAEGVDVAAVDRCLSYIFCEFQVLHEKCSSI
uniref:Uncharacterized protein n=1 Tax=Oryza nivara TaxID=4536 RepID=A0A0E0FVU2_ORYNI